MNMRLIYLAVLLSVSCVDCKGASFSELVHGEHVAAVRIWDSSRFVVLTACFATAPCDRVCTMNVDTNRNSHVR